MATIGDNIKEARRQSSLSLAKLAQATGLTKGFLSQVESGRSNPSLASLDKIAVALGISNRQLITNAQTPQANPLVPAFPCLIGTETAFDNNGRVEIVNATEAGTHLLVTLPPGAELVSEGDNDTAAILTTVLEGKIRLSQVSGTLQVGPGNIGTWNGANSYTISTLGSDVARLFLFVPRVLSLPDLKRSNNRDIQHLALVANATPVTSQVGYSRTISGNSDGPLRLVAMRAQRLAERKRTR